VQVVAEIDRARPDDVLELAVDRRRCRGGSAGVDAVRDVWMRLSMMAFLLAPTLLRAARPGQGRLDRFARAKGL
jgi:hypothetical protein